MDITRFLTILVSAVLLAGCEHGKEDRIPAEQDGVPRSAQEIRPLLVGAQAPKLSLNTLEGRSFDLNSAIARKPTVIVFYRGGWCMYCNNQLSQLVLIEEQIKNLGFQIIAISPDKPKKLAESIDKHHMRYTLLSDSTVEAAKAFGIAFKLDDATLAKYAEYGIDLDDASGQSHHLLPVPSVFITDTAGTIKFQYVNPDYKTRLDPNTLLAALKAEATGNQ
ncbi:MAG: peroxiredoxin-like family protein [Planctomycetota bacterium]|jgi:peroxiredoxin